MSALSQQIVRVHSFAANALVLPAIDGVKWDGVRRPLKRARAASAAPRTWRCCLCRLLHGLVQLSTPAFASWVIGQVRACICCRRLRSQQMSLLHDIHKDRIFLVRCCVETATSASLDMHWIAAQVLQEGLTAATLRYQQLSPSPQLLPHFVADVLHLTCTAYMFTLQRSLPTTSDLLASSKVNHACVAS